MLHGFAAPADRDVRHQLRRHHRDPAVRAARLILLDLRPYPGLLHGPVILLDLRPHPGSVGPAEGRDQRNVSVEATCHARCVLVSRNGCQVRAGRTPIGTGRIAVVAWPIPIWRQVLFRCCRDRQAVHWTRLGRHRCDQTASAYR